jgi:hypothetical protein
MSTSLKLALAAAMAGLSVAAPRVSTRFARKKLYYDLDKKTYTHPTSKPPRAPLKPNEDKMSAAEAKRKRKQDRRLKCATQT